MLFQIIVLLLKLTSENFDIKGNFETLLDSGAFLGNFTLIAKTSVIKRNSKTHKNANGFNIF